MLWRMPFKGAHGKCVISSVPDFELVFEVIKRIELMIGVEILIVFSMASFNLAVMSGRVWFNQLVFNAELFQCRLKECLFVWGI